MKNIGTKSVNMSDIMVYLAIFSTLVGSNFMILGPHKMKMSHYFISLWYPLELGTFLISEDHPPNFELFPTETWDFFDFSKTPPQKKKFQIPKFRCFFDWKASLKP